MVILQLLAAFQSTLPARGATEGGEINDRIWRISIHAPRTGSDMRARWTSCLPKHFNPRSPHGERLLEQARESKTTTFQSTLPARGATRACWLAADGANISIHAPRTGSDTRGVLAAGTGTHFNPRSPHGERQEPHGRLRGRPSISIHAPRTGSDS